MRKQNTSCRIMSSESESESMTEHIRDDSEAEKLFEWHDKEIRKLTKLLEEHYKFMCEHNGICHECLAALR